MYKRGNTKKIYINFDYSIFLAKNLLNIILSVCIIGFFFFFFKRLLRVEILFKIEYRIKRGVER